MNYRVQHFCIRQTFSLQTSAPVCNRKFDWFYSLEGWHEHKIMFLWRKKYHWELIPLIWISCKKYQQMQNCDLTWTCSWNLWCFLDCRRCEGYLIHFFIEKQLFAVAVDAKWSKWFIEFFQIINLVSWTLFVLLLCNLTTKHYLVSMANLVSWHYFHSY